MIFSKEVLDAAMVLPEVKRYHMVDTIGTQDVAQHSFRVAFIAARIVQESLVEGLDPLQAFFFGASHDLAEVVTGDIPSHTKNALRRKEADPDHLVNPVFAGLPEMPVEYKWVIKAADYIEAISWLSKRALSQRSSHVLGYIRQAFEVFLLALDEERDHVVQKVFHEVMNGHIYGYDLEWKHDGK